MHPALREASTQHKRQVILHLPFDPGGLFMARAAFFVLALIIGIPFPAAAKDWELRIGPKVECAWGRIYSYTGKYSERVTEMAPNGQPPQSGPQDKVGLAGPTSNGRPGLMLLTLDGRWQNLVLELGLGLESLGMTGVWRYEMGVGLRAPPHWRLGYESELFSAFPSILLGLGWGVMENTPTSDYDYIRRIGPFGSLSARYDLRISRFFLRAEVQYRAMLTKRQDWLDLGDSGAYEYRFEGLGFSHDVALALAAGVAL